MTDSCMKRMSGAFSNASEEKAVLTSDFLDFIDQTASFSILPVTFPASSTHLGVINA